MASPSIVTANLISLVKQEFRGGVEEAPEEKVIEMQHHHQQLVIEKKCQVFPKCFSLATEVVSGSNAFSTFMDM